jgi:hypothetical protein
MIGRSPLCSRSPHWTVAPSKKEKKKKKNKKKEKEKEK